MSLLRDRRAELEEAGARPFGISRDSPWTHVAWSQVLDLNFALLSDWNAEATHGFRIAHEFRGMRDVPERTAFLVDEQGTVRGAWRYESSDVPDIEELVAAARALERSS
jgi:peroxiredoxin